MASVTVPKREQKRSRVFLSAEVVAESGAMKARIRDISTTGALLEAENPPAAGGAVQVSCGQARMNGRTAWSERGWFGVEFDTPLAMGSIADGSGARLSVSAPRTYRASDTLE